MHNHDETNRPFQLAASFIHYTGRHIFLTGKAGSGKTTFLRSIVKTVRKKAIVVAPTGVAAINAGGVTMHSFFQLPIGIYAPVNLRSWDLSGTPACDKSALLKNLRLNSIKKKTIEELELLVIDEVSMARADMIDAMDAILRHVRKRPYESFGGVQLLMIGDLFQLPPVTVQDEWSTLSQFYDNPFFFEAHAFKDMPPLCIELQKIYRQSDQEFIGLLNRVRNNQVTENDLEWLNSFYKPGFKPAPEDHYITLVSHNHIADSINKKALESLPGKRHEFKAEVEGLFNDNAYPADEVLHLKEGAQIMFIRNDKGEDRKYYNGKIGVVQKISPEGITISFPGDDNEFLLEKEEWKNIRYRFNEEKKQIEEDELGSFLQYPIRLAWAVTIHKSQGLTFDKAVIDAGASFTAGQVYVALSRLTSANGLVLRSRIERGCIQCNDDVVSFMALMEKENELKKKLREEQKEYICKTLLRSFEWEKITGMIGDFIENYRETASPMSKEAILNGTVWLEKARDQKQVADKFILELKKILLERERGYQRLEERIKAAKGYFTGRLQEEIIGSIAKHLETVKRKTKTKKYLKSVLAIHAVAREMNLQLEHAVLLSEGLNKGSDSARLLEQIEKEKNEADHSPILEVNVKRVKGETRIMTLERFRQGKSVPEIAEERGLAVSTIGGHLAEFIRTGEVSVYELLPEEKIARIMPLVESADNHNSTPIKLQLGDDYSYADIRAVINHCIWKKETKQGGMQNQDANK